MLAEVGRAKGAGSGPIQIAGNHTLVAPGNAYATNEGCSIAGKEYYEGRRQKSRDFDQFVVQPHIQFVTLSS
jgi:hypothetical protein